MNKMVVKQNQNGSQTKRDIERKDTYAKNRIFVPKPGKQTQHDR